MPRATDPIIVQNFNMGGLSDSKFSGTPSSVYKLTGFDPHSTPGILKVAQKMTKDSGIVVTEYCKARLVSSNGRTYWGSSISGKIWERDTAGTWTLVHTIVPTTGSAAILGLVEYQKYIYIITQDRVHRILATNAEGAAEWTANISLNWAELNLDQTIGGTGATAYSLTTGVNEGATHKQTFVAGEPVLESVRVKVVAIGTGNWTVTVHDASNNVIGSKQILNASMATGLVYFTFATPLDITRGSTYHIHVHSSVADGTLDTSTNNDLEAAQMSFLTSSDSEFHPTIEQNLVLYIGDKNYIHQVDAGVFSREALNIQTPLRIKSLGKIATRILAGTYVSDKITKTVVIDWDTFSDSFRVSDEIDEVGINAFFEADNYVYCQCGLAGNIYTYDGEQLNLARKIPGDYSPTAQALVNPTAVANLEGQMLFGVSNVTGNPCDQGGYRIGRYSNGYPYIMDFPYPISQRLSGEFILSSVEIGGMLVAGSDVYQSWKRSVVITVTIADPGVVTFTGHGLTDGDAIVFSTTGALPTGITAGTIYFVRSTGTNTLNLYDTSANAISGGATGRVVTSGTQSGVHTAYHVGIDKIDYSNKLDGAYLETRVARIDRFQNSVFPRTDVAYSLLPVSTAINLAYKKNYATNYVEMTEKTDTDRNLVYSEEGIEATTLQTRVKMTASANTAPEIEALKIDIK